jgi:hypothetical protein
LGWMGASQLTGAAPFKSDILSGIISLLYLG